ncbi:hypothetical protein [Bacillus pinisoli]|uniref:hypothetical protein n=1 Tax=Bacillus pinisoli TaxID=2901866 RepID=UPI001FF26174|nr:hypothetical protein [Bacillus pinisoli]
MKLAKIILHLLFLTGFLILTIFEAHILVVVWWLGNIFSVLPVIGLLFYHITSNLYISYLVIWGLVGLTVYIWSKKAENKIIDKTT